MESHALCDLRISDELQKGVDQYFTAAEKVGVDSRAYSRAQDTLAQSVRRLRGTPCENEQLNAYAIEVAFRSVLKVNLKYSQMFPEVTQSEWVKTLLLIMSSRGRLVPLTPSLRESFGPGWESTSVHPSTYSPSILGAYDCLNGTIWYDPYLPPVNLGSVLAHEVDHLLRDKITFEESWDSRLLDASADEIMILDEVMANMMSSLSQFRFYRDSNRDYAFQVRREHYMNWNAPHWNQNYEKYAFGADQDLSLFSKDGALASIWGHLFARFEESWTPKQKRWAKKSARRLDSDRFKYGPRVDIRWSDDSAPKDGIPVFGGFDVIYTALMDPDVVPQIEKVISLVGQIYYPSKVLDTHRLALLLQKWVRDPQLSSTASPLERALSIERNYRGLFKNSDIEEVLRTPSKGCSAVTATRPSGEGVRPSGEGVRPSGEGVRPSGE
ncbi:MAG: hypothetical protein H7222_17690, partial [Methylotenera sp.]|nr:hypothetical protein [Oligoflexia bacterium]